MKPWKKWLCLALASLMLSGSAIGLVGCADSGDDGTDTSAPTQATSEGETVEVDHRFDGVNYGGRAFRIQTSTNIASPGMGNSNFLIEGNKEIEGGGISDAVVERNINVQNALGVTLEFTQIDVNYLDVPAEVRKLTSSGLDEYDLVINDIFPFAQLSIESRFRNILEDDCVFDFERSYWYGDYMEDIRLYDGYQYILAGDYFIDVIRSAHLLLLNKEIYRDFYQRDPDELYDIVLNYEWTFAKMNEIITGVYADTDNGGTKTKGDVFGFMTPEYWGGSIAYSISGNPTYIERDDDGIPTVVLNQGDRANQLGEAMSAIFNNDCSSVGLTADADLLSAFANGEAMILDYQRLGSLENEILREMEGDACVLPLPMLRAEDKKYVTSAHDTTEVGAILATSTDLEFISTVVEVLNRETANVLMPKYYKEGLKVQYVDDSKAARMIDIIHDNFDNSFALAYNEALGGMMLQSFRDVIEQKRQFTAVYAGRNKTVNTKLTEAVKSFMKNNSVG